jgi:two-component system sensor histidine kinase CpxA
VRCYGESLVTTPQTVKVSFPLSLKVSLWLLLNVAVLGALAVGFLLVQGGAGLDSAIRGAAGRRVQQLGAVVVGEYAAAEPGAARQAVLARFGEAYGAEFIVFHREAGPPPELPEEVYARVVDRPPRPGDPKEDFRRGAPPEDSGEFGTGRGGRGPRRKGGPPPLTDDERRSDERAGSVDPARGRFIVHTSNPSAYWLGVRVPFGERPVPALLLARVDTWTGVVRLLDLQPWLLAAAGVFVFSVLFWLPLVHGITRDIRHLTTATGRIADGKFETRVETDRRDEIGRLGESVNGMAARLDTLVNGQKRFLGDVAHELGSPLGRLQVAVEILETHAPDALQPEIRDVREEVQQMTTLVNELLAFTKAGLRPRDVQLTPLKLGEILPEVLRREDPNSHVRREIDPDLLVLADAILLSRAIGNLVRNALRYAGDSSITLRAQREEDRVLIVVEDEGLGVPAEALVRLGEPFYRPEVARTRETGGVGLGLAIVRAGVVACGGEIRFSNREPHGFRAEVRLASA